MDYHRFNFSVLISVFCLLLSRASNIDDRSETLDIYWNRSNDLFTDSVSPNSLQLAIRDKIRFHCPYYDEQWPSFADDEKEYYIIYRVPQVYYNSCSIPEGLNYRQLLALGIEQVNVCSNPARKQIFTTVVEQFSALPGSHGGLIYRPGETYYFTSFSSGTHDGLENRQSALSSCRNNNMKFKLHVCCDDSNGSPTPKIADLSSNQKDPSPSAVTEKIHSPGQIQSTVRRLFSPPPPVYRTEISSAAPVIEKETTKYIKPKYPQAIINAEIQLGSSSASVCLLPSALITGLLMSLYSCHMV